MREEDGKTHGKGGQTLGSIEVGPSSRCQIALQSLSVALYPYQPSLSIFIFSYLRHDEHLLHADIMLLSIRPSPMSLDYSTRWLFLPLPHALILGDLTNGLLQYNNTLAQRMACASKTRHVRRQTMPAAPCVCDRDLE